MISGHLADVLLVPAGDDVLVIEKSAGGVQAEVPANLDQSRRAARVRLDAAPATVLPGARGLLTGVARAVLAAEAAGVARETTEQAAEYAKVRQQFGRPIATFQAVKHHCANMLVAAELAAAASWDAGRAGIGGGDQLSYTAAIAAVLAVPAAVSNASLNIQVHGGIGFTWEHDAHLYLRRAAAIAAVADAEQAAIEVTDLVRRGVRRAAAIDLPAEAEPIRAAIRPDVARLRDLTGEARKQALIETGYVMPHWPKPWGRDASAIEQLVIEQEFAAAGIKRPGLRHHRLDHPDPDPARQPGPGGALGPPGAQPGRDLVPAVQRAGRRVRRGRHQDEGDQGREVAGGSTARRSGPAARTWPASAWPRCGRTRTRPSTRASPRW